MVNYDFDKGDPDFETVMVGAMEAEHRIAYTIINTFDEMLVTSRQKAIAAAVLSAAMLVKLETSKRVMSPGFGKLMDRLVEEMLPEAEAAADRVREEVLHGGI
jgi:hypothetical protein